MIGTYPYSVDPNLYLRNYVSGESNSLLGAFQSSYHVFEVLWQNGLGTAIVDHNLTADQSSNVPTGSLPVTFYNYNNSLTQLNVDWVFVRQYRDPEPTTSVRNFSDIQQTFSLSVGANPFDLVYASIDVTTLGSLSSVQIIYYRYSHPNATPSIQTGRYWEIIPDTALTDYDLSLTVRHALKPDANDLLCYYTSVPDWDCAASSYDPDQFTITRSGLNHLSEWAVEENSPTAIQLQSLRVFAEGNLSWLSALVIALVSVIGMVMVVWFYRMRRKSLN